MPDRRRDPESLHRRALILAARGEYRRSYIFHRAASSASPGNGVWLCDAGSAAHAIGFNDEAASYLDLALRIDPNYAVAWKRRGDLQFDAGYREQALSSYLRAIELDPQDRDSYLSAARCILAEQRPAIAIQRLHAALPSVADPLHAQRGVALALADRGDYEEAVPILVNLVDRSPGDYKSMRVLAELHSGLRDWNAARFWFERAIEGNEVEAVIGWLLYWSRFGDFERSRQIYRARVQGHEFDGVLLPLKRRWEGQDIRGKTLHLIAGDIYLGDALQFVRFARFVKEAGGNVIVQTPRRLRPLLQGMEGVDGLTIPHTPADGADYEAHAFWLLYSMNLPVAEMLGGTPYLVSDPALRHAWREKIPCASGINVGLVWRGSPWRIRDRYGRRSMALEDLRPLASIPRMTLYSLQHGDGREELQKSNPAFPAIDLAPDLPNTCAAMERLDVVVTIDTSIAHLAGAMGKRTFLMLPYDACFRWMLDRDDTPWYPSLRLFRQSKPGEWSDLVTAVARALREIHAR